MKFNLEKEVCIMKQLDLSKYGITGVAEIVHNPSYEELFAAETDPALSGFEKGQETELGAVNVMTGIYTGRSPKDKFIVMDENSKDTVWWTSDEFKNDNHPCSEETWKELKDIAVKELSGKKLYVQDVFCGTNADTRMAIRFIMEVAWQAHFVKNMFITPTDEELANFEPDFVCYNASKAKVENYKELGWSNHVNSSITKSTAGYNSVLSDKAKIGKNCYLEVSYVHSKAKIGDNVLLSYIDIHDEIIPSDVVIHGLKQKDGKFVARIYGVNDNPKEDKLFGKPLSDIFPESVWQTADHSIF